MTPAPAAPVKQPTDDPTIAGDVPKPPDFAQYFQPAMQRIQELEAKRAAVPAIDPQQVKPKLWERLAGVAVGMTQLKNPENAGAVADQVVHRRLHGAEQARAMALQPIDEQLKQAREDFPIYSAAGEAAARGFNAQMDVAKENRERFTAKTNAQNKDEANQIREMYDKGRIEDVKAALEAKLKEIDEKAEKNQKDFEMKSKLLQLQQDLGFEKLNDAKQQKFVGIANSKRDAERKADEDFQRQLDKIDENYRPGSKEHEDALAQARQMRQDSYQRAQNSYEDQIRASGGNAEHWTMTPQGAKKEERSTPASQPSAKGETQTAKKVDTINGHKNGEVVSLKGVGRVKITQLYSDGKFDYEPAK